MLEWLFIIYYSPIIHPAPNSTQQSNHLTDAPHLYTLRKNNSSERISKWFLTRIISDQTSGESVPHIVKYPPSNDHFLTKHFFQCSQPVTEHKNQQKGIIPLGPSGARLFSNSSRRPSLGWWQEKQCIGSCIQSSRFHTLKTPLHSTWLLPPPKFVSGQSTWVYFEDRFFVFSAICK